MLKKKSKPSLIQLSDITAAKLVETAISVIKKKIINIIDSFQ